MTVSADEKACTGVHAVISHLAVDTARWSPTAQPFDPAIATRIRVPADALARRGPQAGSAHTSSIVHQNALAFTALAKATNAKKRLQVQRAVFGTRLGYRRLKVVCPQS